ncbi:MAG: molybdenum cofactor guanylyltransferase [Armatimonadetes bacterium]|nr:molybdenum cofactor guanylyltransferase [Armatimonadota bacterium]
MGGDKHRRLFRGRPLLVHTAERLQAVAGDLLVVGGEEGVASWLQESLPGARWVPDRFPGLGPLAGLHAGLLASPTRWCLCLAVDQPLVEIRLLQLLLDSRQGVRAVIPRAGGHLQPLTAAYSTDCAPVVEESLRSGELRAHVVAQRLEARVLEEGEVRRVDPELRSFVNLNTPAELERWSSWGGPAGDLR